MVFWDTTYPIEHIFEKKNLCYKYLQRLILISPTTTTSIGRVRGPRDMLLIDGHITGTYAPPPLRPAIMNTITWT